MRGYITWLFFLLVVLFTVFMRNEANGACLMSYCKSNPVTPSYDRSRITNPVSPTRSLITNTHRQRVGDLYDPGHGRRIQVRDTSRRIIGYIERSGRITNTHRQKIGATYD